MNGYHFVYTLQSTSFPDEHYTGQTDNLKRRLADHNSGKVPHTSKFTPWIIRSATAFRSKERGLAFERYLKSGSERHFSSDICKWQIDVTLHSYRYAWAELTKIAGYPERFARETFGHNSKAVHRAYAKNAHVKLPALEDYELSTK